MYLRHTTVRKDGKSHSYWRLVRSVAAGLRLEWSARPEWDERSRRSEGYYVLRTNLRDWTSESLWRTYIQLSEVEAAFRIHKSELSIRPIWHQRQDRVLAHILVLGSVRE